MSSSSPVPTLTTQPSIYSPQPVYHPNVRSPSLHSRALSDFESTSKASSLLGPSLIRDPSSVASNSTTGYLPTPMDDVMHVPPPLSRDETTVTSYYRNQAFPERLGQHGLTRKYRVVPGPGPPHSPARQRLVSLRTSPPARQRLVSTTISVPTVDVPCSSGWSNVVPSSTPVVAPKMERQRAARDLISRYEDLESAAQAPLITPTGSQRSAGQCSRSISDVSQMDRRNLSLPPIPSTRISPTRVQGANVDHPSVPHSYCLPESPSYFSSFARKGGILRNSLTNLVQLLGDKARSKDNAKKRGSVSPSVSPSRTLNALPKGFRLRLSKRASAGSCPSSSPGKVKGDEMSSKILPDMNELLESDPMVSTLLLYQSPARQTHPSIPDQKTPLWMPYTVSLYPTTIILQVPNPGFSSSSKFQIPLSELYDVHSIVAKDLPPGSVPLPGTIALPSGFGDNIYVFEAQCYGGRIERFATPSMALRTTWVRHLLDVLAGKDPGSKNGDDPSDNVEEGVTSMPNGTPVRSPDSIQSLPSVSSLALASSHGTFASNPVSLPRGAAATIKAVESNFDSKPPTEKRSALMRLSTPTKPLSRIPDSRPSSVSSALRVASTLPNPWDPPTTPSRRPASSIVHRTSSLLSSPQSDRSRMTASPSICRLDERNLVRNRLAMLERQASPSPSRSESVRNKGTKEGSVNWEALSEIRSGRSGSRLSRTTSGMRSPGIGLPPGVSFAERTHSNSGKFSRPMWPFPELVASSDTDSKLGGPILEPGVLRIGLATSRSASGFNTGPVKTRQEAVSPLFSLPRRRAMEPDSKSIQVLGNLHPSRNAQTGPLQSPPKPVTTSMQDPCIQRPILDRLSTLVSAIRESDVAHSTKVSGLGQLIASIQERIVQAVEDSTNIATAENAALVEHVEGLHGTLESLVTRPSLGTDERADLSSIKETIERIDQVISTKLQDSFGNHVKEDREMKTIIAEETDGLKRAVQDLALKLEHTSTQNSVLGKLDALTEIVTLAGVSPSRDVDFMTKFVQQVKDHISSLPAPNLDPPLMDISVIMEKLDLMSESMTNSTTPIDLSAIQAALEDIREFSQTQQISDASLASTTPQTDISDVLMKLDGITAMCQSIMVVRTGATDTETIQEEREAQQTLLNALKEDAEHRTAQAQQTAELVRYSNELNTWLEKFVTNASTQMDGVGAGLGALRRDLGLDPLSTDRQEDTNAGVIQELRAMFEEQIKSTGDIAATLSALLVAFNEEQARSAQARENLGPFATDSVLKMIEVQRQEQEQLLKQLASDLSSDIRGERIRFIEAMSQATSMNVQLHVEEFKKQLTHEVLALTDDVGRLREERKTIQHQIAQLFLVKSEHEAECRSSDAPQPPPRPLPTTRPNGR